MRSWMVRAAMLALLAAAGGIPACGDKLEPAEFLDCEQFTIPDRPSFDTHVSGILAENCSTCHATSLTGDARNDAPTDVNYDGYWDARISMPLGLLLANAGSMPPTGYQKLSLEDRCMIEAWIETNYPE